MSDPDKPVHLLGGTAIKPKERHGWERIRYILHNPETGTILTRTPLSWALITLFYLVYYTFLASFWALIFFVFWQTIDPKTPKWIAEQSIIGTSPGLGMRPEQTDALIDSSMIFFNKDSKDDSENVAGWGSWVERLDAFLSTYENEEQHGLKCSETVKPKPGSGEACHFDLSNLGPCNNKGHGYDIGQPCIFLKLNRIFGVTNDVYNDPENLPEEMPQHLKDHIKAQPNKDQVWVDCRGEYPADEEGMGNLVYYPPSRGFPSYYFPFENQDHYESPLVAIQFKNLNLGQLLHIECRAWAKNIDYDRRARMGISHFELYVLNSTMVNNLSTIS
jgi:sodium/potassium-transporting ATPase subunit beta